MKICQPNEFLFKVVTPNRGKKSGNSTADLLRGMSPQSFSLTVPPKHRHIYIYRLHLGQNTCCLFQISHLFTSMGHGIHIYRDLSIPNLPIYPIRTIVEVDARHSRVESNMKKEKTQ